MNARARLDGKVLADAPKHVKVDGPDGKRECETVSFDDAILDVRHYEKDLVKGRDKGREEEEQVENRFPKHPAQFAVADIGYLKDDQFKERATEREYNGKCRSNECSSCIGCIDRECASGKLVCDSVV